LSLCMGGVWSAGWIETAVSIKPADQTPPIQSDKYHCHIDTVIFSFWWAYWCPKHIRREINIQGYSKWLSGF